MSFKNESNCKCSIPHRKYGKDVTDSGSGESATGPSTSSGAQNCSTYRFVPTSAKS